jgi:hypothetical protein
MNKRNSNVSKYQLFHSIPIRTMIRNLAEIRCDAITFPILTLSQRWIRSLLIEHIVRISLVFCSLHLRSVRALSCLNSLFELFHSNTFRLSIVWPIRELTELLITTPDRATGNFEESRSSLSKSSDGSGKHHCCWGVTVAADHTLRERRSIGITRVQDNPRHWATLSTSTPTKMIWNTE